jgi:hypothetical protein
LSDNDDNKQLALDNGDREGDGEDPMVVDEVVEIADETDKEELGK